jgi:hypothetical protein
MATSNLVDKLEKFLNLSSKKQEEKQEKLIKIIRNLEEKKQGIMEDMAKESEHDETSERYNELNSELKVIARLLSKARKHVRDEKLRDQEQTIDAEIHDDKPEQLNE